MATRFESLSERHREFIDRQSVFFVATAARTGRVNVSPKGLDTLRVLGPNRVVWLSLTGSGNETSAHLLDQNRMTVMFCAFEGKPVILRLYGTASEVLPCQPGWSELAPLFPPLVGSRQIFDLDIDLVQTSCGFGVPLMEHVDDRALLLDWAMKKGPEGLREYRREKNLVSIDGLPTGLDTIDAAPALSFRPAHTDDALQDWCTVHNLVVPADLISLETARDRSQARLLEVVYRHGELVGCSTLRPSHDDPAVGSLIVRVLPDCRERGIGTAMLARGLAHLRSLGATTVETVVWGPNARGLRFARRHGFVETERYEVPDLEGTWIDLRLDLSTSPGRNPSW